MKAARSIGWTSLVVAIRNGLAAVVLLLWAAVVRLLRGAVKPA
jgi:hypothetical protein